LSTQHDYPVKGFLETSFIDWKEKLAAVTFSGGCNFRCPFCHNRDLVLRPNSIADVPLDHIFSRLRKFNKWIEHVVVTGGEPTIHKGLVNFLETLKKQGLKVKLDTNGSNPHVVKELVNGKLVDYLAMDMKGPIASYRRWCGSEVDTDKIRESVDFILEGNVDYEFRMTVVPFLHHERDVYEAAEEIKEARRFFLQAFVPRDTINTKYVSVRPFSPEKMKAMRDTVRSILTNASIRHNLQQ